MFCENRKAKKKEEEKEEEEEGRWAQENFYRGRVI